MSVWCEVLQILLFICHIVIKIGNKVILNNDFDYEIGIKFNKINSFEILVVCLKRYL